MLTLALVENLQRADLNPIEEAEGYQRLIGEFGLTQQQVADAVGKDRTTITNMMRMLSLPALVRSMVESGNLSTGHARALLPIKDERRQIDLANEIVARQLSVRDAEARARGGVVPRKPEKHGSWKPSAGTEPLHRTHSAKGLIEDRLRRLLQTDVHIQALGEEKGVIQISFYSSDDLDRVLDLVLGPERSDFD